MMKTATTRAACACPEDPCVHSAGPEDHPLWRLIFAAEARPLDTAELSAAAEAWEKHSAATFALHEGTKTMPAAPRFEQLYSAIDRMHRHVLAQQEAKALPR